MAKSQHGGLGAYSNAIKIDVEGFEPSVFAGLSGTIAQCRPVIVFERLWLSDNQVKQFVLSDYLLHFIHDDGTSATDFSSRLKGHDAIFILEEKTHLVERLCHIGGN